MKISKHVFVRAALLCVGLGLAAAGSAQDTWPDKPVIWVSTSAAGGNADVLARMISIPLSTALAVPVVIENRNGASGTIAGGHVAKAARDGYTILGGAIAGQGIAPVFNKNLPYDSAKDLTPVTLLGTGTNYLVVPENSRFKSVADIVEASRAKPGSLSFGSLGVGTTGHLAGVLLQKYAGMKMLHIPNTRSALNELAGGHTDLMFDGAAVMPMVRAGKIRVLAVASKTRSDLLPDVPTMAELGYPQVEIEAWHAVFVPTGTPQPVIARLHKEIEKIVLSPDMRKRFEQIGMQPSGMGPDKFAQYVKAEHEKWGSLIRSEGIKQE